jgi:hypothetical protein
MTARIFHLQSTGKATPLSETPFPAEDLLQRLIAENADLLPGDQIDPGNPRRFLLIDREVSVPGEGAIGFLDHLFVDQDATPTLVEVKRGGNPQIRREVIGQLLEYAANAPLTWAQGRIRALFEARCVRDRRDPREEMHTALGDGLEEEPFWAAADLALRERRMRLIVVTDRLAPELRRIVEFLNQTMEEIEVLAVEIRQYAGEGPTTLVPTVHGRTLAAEQKKSQSSQRDAPWTAEEHLATTENERGSQARAIAEALLAWCEREADRVWWGRGKLQGSFFPEFFVNGRKILTFAVWTYGRIEIQFEGLKRQPPFTDPVERESLRRELSAAIGTELPVDKIDKRPSFDILLLAPPAALEGFLRTMRDVVTRAAAAAAATAS